MENTFELLAPAGSYEIFKAVIDAGTDAVYAGGSRFGARAYADNFSKEELLDAIDYAHLHRKKVYMTVNTLLKNTEMSQLYDYLLPFYERGLDAVIVQDSGVFQFIKGQFGGLDIHASTQMTAASSKDVSFLQKLGAKRIVLSRELSLAEMKQIHEETGAELEVFIHGALCYSYSGQCLMSSILGGRSGNRGRCAQPCRLPYTVCHNTQQIKKDAYVLSLKDLCGINDLNKLYEAGVYSLKIEGRMKQLAYASGVVSFYRKYIDLFLQNLSKGQKISKDDFKELMALGNRCGFTDGYYHKPGGPDMVTFIKPSYEKSQTGSPDTARESCTAFEKKIPVDAVLRLHTEHPAEFELSAGQVCIQADGMPVMEAKSKPLAEDDVEKRMKKTKDTPFEIKTIKIEIDHTAFLPNGALNQLRRDAVSMLKEQLLKQYRRIANKEKMEEMLPALLQKKKKPRIICLTEERKLLPLILKQPFVTTVYLDFCAYSAGKLLTELKEDVSAAKQAEKEVFFAMPRIFRQKTVRQFEGMTEKLRLLPLDGFLVRTYGEINYLKKFFPEYMLAADHNLYTYNDTSVNVLEKNGLYNTVPLELNRKEILHRDNHASEMVIYGYYPLMVSAQCISRNTAGCNKTPGIIYLKDRKHAEFPVKNNCSACYNVIYNSLPTMLFPCMGELGDAGIEDFRLDFTIENEDETAGVFSLFKEFLEGKQTNNFSPGKNQYTNGHYKRGVE